MARKKLKATHGGKRKGAGRPPSDAVSKTFRIRNVTLHLWERRVGKLGSREVDQAILLFLEYYERNCASFEHTQLSEGQWRIVREIHAARFGETA